MSNHEYPRLGEIRLPRARAQPGSGKPCILCKEKTTGKVDVQISWMRGDDEVEPLCKSCQKLPRPTILKKIQEAWKEKT